MEVEMSNFHERAIPKSCPADVRAKIEAARNKPATKSAEQDPETWELMKKFAAEQVA